MSASPSADAPAPGTFPRKIYRASRGRRTTFSFIFLILLPFFLSLPGMLYMRLKHGQIGDSIGLGIFAAAFAVIMLLLLIELLFSVRTRVELADDKVRLTLPSGRGPTPMLRYKSLEVPYDQVQTVETRREVYGGALVPMLLQGARLTLKDGSHVRLGYVSDANVDPTFPYPEIAKEIADRARLPLIDRGNVRRSIRKKYFGLTRSGPASDGFVDEGEIARLNKSHSNVILALAGGLAILMALGLVADFTASKPEARAGLGEPGKIVTPAKGPAKPAQPAR